MLPEKMNPLRACRLGIDTHHEPYIYLRADSPVCKSEGFNSLTRVLVASESQHIIATLNIVTESLIEEGHVGFSESAWERLGLKGGESIWISHPRPVQSLSYVRSKVYGHRINAEQFQEIIKDIVDERYADVHLAAFITACGDDKLDDQEITDLTRAMINAGSTIDWGLDQVLDKHCVGGLPGNRTTPIVVSILTAAGLTIPKTSSRAITSPAGTADTMETLTNVSLTLDQMRDVVNNQGGCLAWGGSVRLSPADDLLIQVERALDIDSEGQLIASVLSKKVAAGATHVLIDIPVGPTAKVRSQEAADQLASSFSRVAENLGIKLAILKTDGTQPIGEGIGPALEARDILRVLQNQEDAPQDLLDRATLLAGAMLELSGQVTTGKGKSLALELIQNGQAWSQFVKICEAQGKFTSPPVAHYRYEMLAEVAGVVSEIDNRLLAKVAKLAGAPADLAAGVDLHVKCGYQVARDQPLLTVHAEHVGELNYAVDYLLEHLSIVKIEGI
jgi:thymidine phosphorylase